MHVKQQLLTVHIVDDDLDVRSSLENFLRSAGISVRTFGSAEQYLDDPQCALADCLVTDLHMPGLNGFALRAELRRRNADIPVLLMSAYLTAETQDECGKLGMAGVFAKPVDPEILLDRIRQLHLSEGRPDERP